MSRANAKFLTPMSLSTEPLLLDPEMQPADRGELERGSRHHYVGPYEGETPGVHLKDEFWGETFIPDSEDDGLWSALFHHNAAVRLMGIPNLTMPNFGAIIPGSHDMSRWEHAWGSVVLTRRLMDKYEQESNEKIDPIAKRNYQLATYLSDFGHTIGSHLGDWVKQGFGGPENAHDESLKAYLQRCGIAQLLEAKGITIDDVVFPEKTGGYFIEKDAPDLCVDRVDWSVRQICGRFLGRNALSAFTDLSEEFTLYRGDNNELQMACTDADFAVKYASAFALLVSEHFNHPVHNYLLRLYGIYLEQALAYDSVSGNMTHSAFHEKFNPADLLYLVDRSMLMDPEYFDSPLSQAVPGIIANIARPQREAYGPRRKKLERIVGHLATGQEVAFPEQSIVNTVSPPFPSLEIVKSNKVSDGQDRNPFAPRFRLNGLKSRQIDPPVITVNGIRPISEIYRNIVPFLVDQKRILQQTHLATLRLDPKQQPSANTLFQDMNRARTELKKLSGIRLLDDREFRRNIIMSGAGVAFHRPSLWSPQIRDDFDLNLLGNWSS